MSDLTPSDREVTIQFLIEEIHRLHAQLDEMQKDHAEAVEVINGFMRGVGSYQPNSLYDRLQRVGVKLSKGQK